MRVQRSWSKVDAKNIFEIIGNIKDQCSDDKFYAKGYAKAFNSMLDGLLEDDFFGSEGSTDPRGDRRELGR